MRPLLPSPEEFLMSETDNANPKITGRLKKDLTIGKGVFSANLRALIPSGPDYRRGDESVAYLRPAVKFELSVKLE